MARPLLTERPPCGRPACRFAAPSAPLGDALPPEHRRAAPPDLPALDEETLRTHFALLAQLERAPWPGAAAAARAAHLPGLTRLHPEQPQETIQGALEVLHDVARALAALTGLERFSLQPRTFETAARGALLVARASLARTQPARTHLVAPAGSLALRLARHARLQPHPIERLPSGELDIDALDEAVGDATALVAAAWLTPSGAFERGLTAAAEVAHTRGALLAADATGLARLAGHTRLREAGVDIAWLHLAELCPEATGAAIGVRSPLTEALPGPLVGKTPAGFELDAELSRSIGPLALTPGHLDDALAVWIAIHTLGEDGLRDRATRLAT